VWSGWVGQPGVGDACALSFFLFFLIRLGPANQGLYSVAVAFARTGDGHNRRQGTTMRGRQRGGRVVTVAPRSFPPLFSTSRFILASSTSPLFFWGPKSLTLSAH